jgi:hypothetical protein
MPVTMRAARRANLLRRRFVDRQVAMTVHRPFLLAVEFPFPFLFPFPPISFNTDLFKIVACDNRRP